MILSKYVPVFLLIFGLAATSSATVINFQPDPADLYDLDHNKYYDRSRIIGTVRLQENVK
ncbi:MAG: hypothetical protein JXR49_11770 [Acidobacteria bacterium]|nr:hypothetical protein [Acidobacteriota bacterium]